MKIDNNCIIAVLESVEEATTYYDSFHYSPVDEPPKRLSGYDHEKIIYHIEYCKDQGYFKGCSILNYGAMITVDDLSKDGHEYLKEVRSHTLRGVIKSAVTECRNEGVKAAILKLFELAIKWISSIR